MRQHGIPRLAREVFWKYYVGSVPVNRNQDSRKNPRKTERNRSSSAPIGDKSAPPEPSLPQPKTHEEIESLPKESLYRTTAGGKKFIAVRGEGKRGGGDRLFETIEESSHREPNGH